jgi:hypothetical protein
LVDDIPSPNPESAHDERFTKLVAIVAPPRSGTTVVTAALSVHSDVLAVYEPWNDNKSRIDSTNSMMFADFVRNFVPAGKPGSILLVKETATHLHYIRRVAELLATAPSSVDRQSIVILRNPFHVFLSEVQARREWWGAEDLQIDAVTFSRWAQRMLESCHVIAGVASENDSLLLSYDAFSRDESGVQDLTRIIGLEPEPAQAEFERHLDRSAVRGDIRVSNEPRPISARSVDYRDQELAKVIDLFSGTPEFAAIERLALAFASLPSLSRSLQRPDTIAAMRRR